MAFLILAIASCVAAVFCTFAEMSEFAGADADADADLEAVDADADALYEEYTDAEVDEAIKRFIFKAGGGGVTKEQVGIMERRENEGESLRERE